MQLGIYIHIPFCLHKCYYCDFNSYPNKSRLIKDYITAVLHEIRNTKYEIQIDLSTLYFGGGTPSLLSSEHIGKVIAALSPFQHDIEITLEANPGTVNLEKLKQFKQVGVNRISFGIQSFDKTVLSAMGRIHTVQDNLECYQAAREAGFDNLSVDLMFGYPNQTADSWQKTIEQTISLRPEHMSVYGLTIEPGTKLDQEVKLGKVKPMDEEIELEMYQYTIDNLTHAGYTHYEISNFAMPEKECLHNLNYWIDGEYLGFGAGAHSYVKEKRFWNIESPEEYIQRIKDGQSPIIGSERLDGKRKMAEFAMLALRTKLGVDLKKFYTKFHQEFDKVFQLVLPNLFDSGLLEQNNGHVRFTAKGIILSNEVFSRLFE